MAERCPEAQITALAAELGRLDSALPLLGAESPLELERLSRDYYDYSPVLVPLLQGCRAQLVARATTVEQVLLEQVLQEQALQEAQPRLLRLLVVPDEHADRLRLARACP